MAENLSLLLLIPLVGALVVAFLPGGDNRRLKWVANGTLALSAPYSLSLLRFFSPGQDFQFVQRGAWIPALGADWYLGVDGYSLLLVVMTSVVGFLAALASWGEIDKRVREFYVVLLLLQCLVNGVFLALDGLLFFVFFEATLVPMYFLIAIWGGEKRRAAAVKFLIYTGAGSMLLLLGLVLLYWQHGQATGVYTFSIPALWVTAPEGAMAQWIFWLLFVGLAVKVPMAPLHTWLPDAHTEAPTAGSVYLASVMLKMGTYGFLRLVLPGAPAAARNANVSAAAGVLALVAILYGALVCLKQRDWKRLIAYSSVSHMGFAMLGLFTLNPQGIAGSMLEQLNHGISTGLLFLLVGLAYSRRGTREIAEYGGLFVAMPAFSMVFLIAAVSSMGLPPLNGFIGELRILTGAWEMSGWWLAGAGAGVVLTVAYLLWCYQRVVLGEVAARNQGLKDLTVREWAVVLPLVAAAVGIGVYPQPVLDLLERPARQVVEKVRPGYYARSN